jgi:hypothetical protein
MADHSSHKDHSSQKGHGTLLPEALLIFPSHNGIHVLTSPTKILNIIKNTAILWVFWCKTVISALGEAEKRVQGQHGLHSQTVFKNKQTNKQTVPKQN